MIKGNTCHRMISGRICGPKKKKGLLEDAEDEVNDNISLLPKAAVDLPVSIAAHIPKSVSLL